MNTVPFDQLGPGQSGRLAYQVLGQNGPIFNPQNIRYLSPDSPEIPTNAMSTGASGLSAGLTGANLIAKWYFAPEEVPHLDLMTFYEESHKAHRVALDESETIKA